MTDLATLHAGRRVSGGFRYIPLPVQLVALSWRRTRRIIPGAAEITTATASLDLARLSSRSTGRVAHPASRAATTRRVRIVTLGAGTDIPVPGDYDGDGMTDIASLSQGERTVVDPCSRALALSRGWLWGGAASDVPVPGDYDGDGKTRPRRLSRRHVVWCLESPFGLTPRSGAWPVGNQRGQSWSESGRHEYGCSGAPAHSRPRARRRFRRRRPRRPGRLSDDRTAPGTSCGRARGTHRRHRSCGARARIIPVAGDYDGDGKTDPAYFRPSTGEWKILYSSTNYATSSTTTLGVRRRYPGARRLRRRRQDRRRDFPPANR